MRTATWWALYGVGLAAGLVLLVGQVSIAFAVGLVRGVAQSLTSR